MTVREFGPWEIGKAKEGQVEIRGKHGAFATVFYDPEMDEEDREWQEDEEAVAVANLFIAAPNLLDTLSKGWKYLHTKVVANQGLTRDEAACLRDLLHEPWFQLTEDEE